jgi:hypothetical protein
MGKIMHQAFKKKVAEVKKFPNTLSALNNNNYPLAAELTKAYTCPLSRV